MPLGGGLRAKGKVPAQRLACAGKHIQPPLTCEPRSLGAIMGGPRDLLSAPGVAPWPASRPT
eukprot:10571086-Lingulodinium_polyedra.AAC.1